MTNKYYLCTNGNTICSLLDFGSDKDCLGFPAPVCSVKIDRLIHNRETTRIVLLNMVAIFFFINKFPISPQS